MFDVMTFLFIFPFISAFIEQTGVPVAEVGFWSGFIESAMSPVQALILPVWGRYSDSVSPYELSYNIIAKSLHF